MLPLLSKWSYIFGYIVANYNIFWMLIFLALKGRYIPAQGNALGYRLIRILALKGRHIKQTCDALSGLKTFMYNYPGRCPGLVYYALSGLRN